MTIYEALSLIISLIALVIAVFTSNKSNKRSQESNHIALRQARARENAIFEETLFTVHQRLKNILSELQQAAAKSYEEVADVLDIYDKQKKHGGPLGGRYFKFCNLLYAALSYELVWQTAESLHFRKLSALLRDVTKRHVAEDKKDTSRLVEMLNFLMYNEPFPSSGILWWNSQIPVNAKMLTKGILEMFERIDITKEVFFKAYDCCQTYFDVFDKVNPIIKESLQELKKLLELDKHKEFKLHESYGLSKDYMETMKKLKFITECDMPSIRHRYKGMHDKYWHDNNYTDDLMGYILYMGVILSIMKHYYTWGLNPREARSMFEKL